MTLKLDYDYYEGQLLYIVSSYFWKPNYLPEMRNTYRVRERTCLVCPFELRVKASVQDMREILQINLHTWNKTNIYISTTSEVSRSKPNNFIFLKQIFINKCLTNKPHYYLCISANIPRADCLLSFNNGPAWGQQSPVECQDPQTSLVTSSKPHL